MKRLCVGEFVSYRPDMERCLVTKEASGYKEDQEFFPASLTRWRVFRNGEDVILVAGRSLGKLTLAGEDGYRSSIGILNYLAECCVNTQFAAYGRCIGSHQPMLEMNRWITRKMDASAYKTPTSFEQNDGEWMRDNGLLPKRGSLWMAEKYRLRSEREDYKGVYAILCPDGDVVGRWLHYANGDGEPLKLRECTREVFPVIYLRSQLAIDGGKGTIRSPWKLCV